MITAHDIHALAVFMVENHGQKALHLANCAVDELDAKNAVASADAWRALRSVVRDMLEGRLAIDQKPTVH
jgi:hypothetical protein